MPTYVFYADRSEKRRADQRNTVVAQGATVAAARAADEALVRAGALASFAVVDVSAAAPAFVVEGWAPVGSRGQSTWPSQTPHGGFAGG
ncbi:hypothetical protein GCM10022268_25380 [Sphingomonas cynarae]|uniref:DUF4242 domain-containing protein n=1 Tax=Sphingomonas cynarae TaxID=930197 RepID=A0ABP7EDG6_9SPHN